MPEPMAALAAQIAAPVVNALLEDVHAYAAAEFERLAKTLPPRLDAAEQDVQDWAHDAHDLGQRLMARLDQARGNLTSAVTPGPTAAETATSTGTSATTTAPANTKPSVTTMDTPADATKAQA